MSKDIKISINIPKEMDDYLHAHPDINRSELFRASVNTIRNPLYKQLSDAVILNFSIMFVISLGFLIILLIPFLSFTFLIVIWILSSTFLIGGIMLFIIKRRTKTNGNG